MNWVKKRVVVTGAAGFLGRHLVKRLVELGAVVTAIDNFSFSSKDLFGFPHEKVNFIEADIVKDDLCALIQSGDLVYHLAALADPRACKENFELAFEVNVRGTKRVLDASKGCARFIFLSGGAVYGDPSYLPIDEKHPLNADDPYAVTKIMGEFLCRTYGATFALPVTIVRNFATFGPGQPVNYVIPTIITQGLSKHKVEIWNASPTRDFLFVENTIDGLIKIAQTERLIGETVNLGSGQEIQIGYLAQKIAAYLGGVPVVSLDKEVVGSKRLCCDNTKLKETTGWEVRISLEEGLQRTIDWFKGKISS